MRIVGSILCGIGLFLLGCAAAYVPTIGPKFNVDLLVIDLLTNQLIYAVVGVGLIASGCALIAGGSVVAALSERLTETHHVANLGSRDQDRMQGGHRGPRRRLQGNVVLPGELERRIG